MSERSVAVRTPFSKSATSTFAMGHQGGNYLGGVDRPRLGTVLHLALQTTQGQSCRGADEEEYERERDP
jgi:hypothetical protein